MFKRGSCLLVFWSEPLAMSTPKYKGKSKTRYVTGAVEIRSANQDILSGLIRGHNFILQFPYHGAKNSTRAKSMPLIWLSKLLSVSSITSELETTVTNKRTKTPNTAIVTLPVSSQRKKELAMYMCSIQDCWPSLIGQFEARGLQLSEVHWPNFYRKNNSKFWGFFIELLHMSIISKGLLDDRTSQVILSLGYKQ